MRIHTVKAMGWKIKTLDAGNEATVCFLKHNSPMMLMFCICT